MSRLIAFGWYGGKFSHLKWLLPLLPKAKHYCEPFGGSAAVLLNRDPSPVETYNDLDGDVVNFFRTLRESYEDLVRVIGLTPFSKEEFVRAIEGPIDGVSEVERARRFYVIARQVRTGLAQTASAGRWAHCRLTSSRGMSASVSRWLGAVEGLPEIAQRLIRVQIENDDALKVIKRYDSVDTLFYCDPPYVHESRKDLNAYAYEMTDQQHRDLAQVLHNVEGRVALSGYRCSLMQELYGEWECTEAPRKRAPSSQEYRQEVLWTNYNLVSDNAILQ